MGGDDDQWWTILGCRDGDGDGGGDNDQDDDDDGDDDNGEEQEEEEEVEEELKKQKLWQNCKEWLWSDYGLEPQDLSSQKLSS